MDWITVAVEHINSVDLKKARSMSSMDVFTCVSSVNLIIESVQQLHRVIRNKVPLPFTDSTDIFVNNQFQQNDLRYFKTLRACFGAHPVNLKEPGQEESIDLRRFASWSSTAWGKGTASVILYPNKPGEKNIYLSVDLSQVFRFGEKYYDYLKVLGECIDKQYESFVALKRKEIIPTPEDTLEHLDVLLEESKQRLDSGILQSQIQELKILFSTEITDKSNIAVVNTYRKDLCLLINEIHSFLQNMDMDDLKYENLLYPSPKTMPNDWNYWREKISEYVFGGGYPPQLWDSQVVRIIEPYVNPVYDSYEELYLLFQATLYYIQQQEQH